MKSCDAMVGLSRAKFVPIIIYTTVEELGQNFNQKLDLVFVSVCSDILISSECNIVTATEWEELTATSPVQLNRQRADHCWPALVANVEDTQEGKPGFFSYAGF